MATPLHSNNSKQQLINALKTPAAQQDRDLADILTRYTTGLVSIQDATIRSIQQANAVAEIALFDPTNEKRDGIYSLSKGILDRDVVFLVTHISLLAYQATTPDPITGIAVPKTLNSKSQEEYAAMLAADNFANVANIPAIANGECLVRINRKPVLDKLSNQVFANVVGPDNKSNAGKNGCYKLENPILIKPQVAIEMQLRLAVATPASTLVEVMFYGACTLAT